MQDFIADQRVKLVEQVKDRKVLVLISGGVDSTVLGALLLAVLPAEQIHLMYMDTGLMRKGETERVQKTLMALKAKHLHIVHCEEDFLTALAGEEEPEAKRKIIGDLFIAVQEREVAKLGLGKDYILAQGTLYSDLYESGIVNGGKAKVIKSHHNVGSPLVAALRKEGRILEPFASLCKDEVRTLGRILGLDNQTIDRHPFPGPGLAVRIIGEVTKERCNLLRKADYIFIEELKKRNLYYKIWQAFAVLLPVQSVGLSGNSRKYGPVLALRAIISRDGMQADVYPFKMEELLEISESVSTQISEISRVTYDITAKPPATIEWE